MQTSLLPAEDAVGLVAAVSDPVRFCRGLLRQDLWPVQEAILRSVDTRPRTAVKACHASGKTFVAAAAVLWFTTRYRDGVVVTTAPTWTQVETVLWGEIHKTAQNSRIAYPALSRTELRLGPGNYAIGLSTNEGVRFQGFHGRVLLVVDEAPGVRPDIWEAIEGIRAGGDVRVLALGNPTISSGPFYDAFTAHRSGWSTFTIGAFDSPNLAGLSLDELLCLSEAELDRNVRPYLVTRRWVREKHDEWGVEHPLWAARVLGQFPAQSDDALISLTWLEEAASRPAPDAGGRVTAGLDVAGPGEDETVLVIADGSCVLMLRAWSDPDPRGAVVACLEGYRHRLDAVNVDAAGLGYYLGKHLQDLGFPVRLVNVGESSSQPDRYRNLKAELYWSLRLRFQGGDVAGLTDERAIGQLAGVLYRHTARGQIEIESKDAARKRGVKSPDRAEAVMLALARVTSVQLLWGGEVNDEQRPVRKDGYAGQIGEAIQDMGWSTLGPEDRPTCATCCHFRAALRRCTLRDFDVAPSLPGCDFYDVALSPPS